MIKTRIEIEIDGKVLRTEDITKAMHSIEEILGSTIKKYRVNILCEEDEQ